MTRPTRLITAAIFAAALGGPIAAAQIDPSLMPSPTPTPIQSRAGDWGMALDLAMVTPAGVGTTPALENEAGITVATVRKQIFYPRPGKKDPIVPPA